MGIRRGWTHEEPADAPHSLALLTKIVKAFNTRWIQRAMTADPELNQPDLVQYIAPTGFEQISLRGIFTFGLERYRDALLDRAV